MCSRPAPSPRDGVAVSELRLQQEEEKQTRGLPCVEINPITEENIVSLLISQVETFFFLFANVAAAYH